MDRSLERLLDALRRDISRFSPAQRSLARYLADHLRDIPLLTAQEVASAAHCSPATVVRFAQSLGFSGYPAIQRAVRQSQRPGRIPGARPARTAGDADLVAQFAIDRLAADDAVERLAATGLGFAIAALTGHLPLLVAGEGHARPVAAMIEERLVRAGCAVIAAEGSGSRDRARMDALPRTGAVIALAIGSDVATAEAALRAAARVGAPAVAIVDSNLCAITRPDVTLVVPSNDHASGPNLGPMIAVGQLLTERLVAAAASRAPGRVAV